MAIVKIKAKFNLKKFSGSDIRKRLTIALINAGDEMATIFIDKAQKHYIKQRITKKMPSKIFDSFKYVFENTTKLKVTTLIIAGGPTAPYVSFVDKGWRFKNGKTKEGYHFMDAGHQEIVKKGLGILRKELKKIGGILKK